MPPHETSPVVKSEEKRIFSQASIKGGGIFFTVKAGANGYYP